MKQITLRSAPLTIAILAALLAACQTKPLQGAWEEQDGMPTLGLDGHCIQLRPLKPEEKSGFCYDVMTDSYQRHHHYEPLDKAEFGFMYQHVYATLDTSPVQPSLPSASAALVVVPAAYTVKPLPYSVNLTTGVSFKLNSAHFSARNRADLRKQFKALEAKGLRVVSVSVTGHTDSSGAAKYNELLSYWRAQSVAYYLRRMHVPEVEIAGAGQYAPRGDGKDPAENRYVDLVVWVQQAGPMTDKVATR